MKLLCNTSTFRQLEEGKEYLSEDQRQQEFGGYWIGGKKKGVFEPKFVDMVAIRINGILLRFMKENFSEAS